MTSAQRLQERRAAEEAREARRAEAEAEEAASYGTLGSPRALF